MLMINRKKENVKKFKENPADFAKGEGKGMKEMSKASFIQGSLLGNAFPKNGSITDKNCKIR